MNRLGPKCDIQRAVRKVAFLNRKSTIGVPFCRIRERFDPGLTVGESFANNLGGGGYIFRVVSRFTGAPGPRRLSSYEVPGGSQVVGGARDRGRHPRVPRAQRDAYSGTSLIRERTHLRPYRRPMPRVLGWSQGEGPFLVSDVPL